MSLQPAIPWRVALQQCPPLLYRPASECDKMALAVKGNIPGDVNCIRLPEALAA
jgi:hypothetical protein